MMLSFAMLLSCKTPDQLSLPAGSEQQPDIILVSIDTLRADHLGSYGYHRDTAPFIDRLAASGVRYHWARSASPWTLPAHTTMFTGQLPATHHIVDDSVSLSPTEPVLPALIQSAGYSTGGFVSTLYVSSVFGFDRGFDHFEDFGLHTEKKNLSGKVVASNVIDESIKWWSKQAAGKPVFAFLHFYDAHYAYDPPAPYETLFDRAPQEGDLRYRNYFYFLRKKKVSAAQFEHQIAQYDEAIRYVDDQLARLDAKLREAGRKVRWVITSDHGEEFGERGSWGHAHTLYAEQLRIPLILSGSGIGPREVTEGWAGNHDIAPTIAAWAGVEQQLKPDGIDLAASMNGAALKERAFLGETTRFKTNRLSLLEGQYRLEWDLKKDQAELFDVVSDPAERSDLAKSQPDLVRAYQLRAEELLRPSAWSASKPGKMSVTQGVLLSQGHHPKALDVATEQPVVVLPYDAPVHFDPTEGAATGPWKLIGGAVPSDESGLTISSTGSAAQVDIDEATRKLLEGLGYIQEEE